MTGPSATIACFGCGAVVPDIDGPTHAYIPSAPGCWQLFGEVLAAEFSDPARWPVHQLTVDTYAVQHPSTDRRGRQSVALHLMGLCLQLEHDLPARGIPPLRAAHLARHRDGGFPELVPHLVGYPHTVTDVVGAACPYTHRARVRRWAESTWEAWGPHHGQVREWALRDLRAPADVPDP
ncbi:MAG TPA: DUF5946 family protein [Acidimicrobiales bacterium]|nr:DUF5946 family protein [Acidimicrobiales bacterium]